MYAAVDTRDTASVEREARLVHGTLFPHADPSFVSVAFGWLLDCFAGRHPGYLPLDTRYHDTEHTMQVVLCFARLLRARNAVRAAPAITQRAFELGLLATLFHDSGYLKRSDDMEGTGAKYTATHVNRGAAFAAALLRVKGFSADDTDAVQKMIHCTAPDEDPRQIAFRSDVDRLAGYAAGTADLLGQMAAPDYLDKLPVLFGEFAEAARSAVAPMPSRYAFDDPRSLLRETPAFWRDYAKPRLEVGFGGLYRYLADPWPDGANAYVEAIERNLERLRAKLESAA